MNKSKERRRRVILARLKRRIKFNKAKKSPRRKKNARR